MLFPTIEFALFFAVIFPINWLLNRANVARKLFLVLASYVFYGAWDWHFVFLLAGSSIGNYAFGWLIAKAPEGLWRRLSLAGAVTANLACLGFFKYWDFMALEVAKVTSFFGPPLTIQTTGIALPVAISFLTFHGLSYIIDIARGKMAPSKSLIDVMLYMGFFPHLVAGPIVRAADFIGQLQHPSDPKAIALGPSMLLILGGLFKKVIIASYLSTKFVDVLWVDPTLANPVDLILGIYAYGVVIYCDFSAYTDMAIGIATMLGYQFPQNFDQPYRAITLQDFWRRWHISLSSWLRDYLYVSLGGSRGSTLFAMRNLMITMILGGLWHGAGLQFIVWGALHGAGLAVERLGGWTKSPQRSIGIILRWLITIHAVLLLWVPFRSGDLDLAVGYFNTILTGSFAASTPIATPFIIGLAILGMCTNFLPKKSYVAVARSFERLNLPLQITLTAAVIWLIVMLAPDGVPPFIYFQF